MSKRKIFHHGFSPELFDEHLNAQHSLACVAKGTVIPLFFRKETSSALFSCKGRCNTGRRVNFPEQESLEFRFVVSVSWRHSLKGKAEMFFFL